MSNARAHPPEGRTEQGPEPRPRSDAKRIAYLVSRFPSTTETFIAREMNEIERWGAAIDLYSLVQETGQLVQPEAETRMAGLTAGSAFRLRELLKGQWYWLRRDPSRLARIWIDALVGNRSSPKFLLRALIVLPVAAVFARRMQERGTEHVHAHWATHPALAAWAVHRLTGLPYSVSTHAHDIYVDQAMLKEKLGEAEFVATISHYNRRLLSDLVPEISDRCHVVRCGVPLRLTAVRPAADDATDRSLRVLCVAQFKPYKGQRHLVEALGELTDAGFDPRVTFAGDGPDMALVKELADELGMQDRVEFLGSVESSRVPELLAEADVFVAPSVVQANGKADGIPVALMEAMTAGVPVVASSLTGIPELVRDGETGLLIEPGNARALAAAVGRIATESGLAERLVEGARKLIAEEFTINGNGARLARLFGVGGSTEDVCHDALAWPGAGPAEEKQCSY